MPDKLYLAKKIIDFRINDLAQNRKGGKNRTRCPFLRLSRISQLSKISRMSSTTVENFQIFQNFQTVENLENLKTVENLKFVQNLEPFENFENFENVQNFETVETDQNPEASTYGSILVISRLAVDIVKFKFIYCLVRYR